MYRHILSPVTAVTLFAVVGLLSSVGSVPLQAEERISVTLKDGRTLEGVVDARSNGHDLWLRFTEPGIALSMPVSWASVQRAQRADQLLSVTQLRALAGQIKTELPEEFFASESVLDSAAGEASGNKAGFSSQQPGSGPSVDVGEVLSLQIFAELANWDRDVEPDGFEVSVLPLDRDRNIVPVAGSVMMRLIGERQRRPDGQRLFSDLQRWSVRAQGRDFGPEGAIFQFPFQTIHPELDLELLPVAMLNVRLGAFHQGVFEASTPVPLRRFNPVRDRLQSRHGHRWFPNELTEQTRQHYSWIEGFPDR